MARFAKNGSRIFLALAWLSVLALFNDGANLTDLFSDTCTIHFDEVYEGPAVATSTSVVYHSSAGQELSPVHQPTVKHIVLDQDSPSLAATSIIAAEISSLCPQKEDTPCQPVLRTELLYLENHSFLL